MADFLGKLFTQNQSAVFLKAAAPVVAEATRLAPEIEALSQAELTARLKAVAERTDGNPTGTTDVAEVFALVREASTRTLKERHYDVQLIGGLVLAKGKIAEMRTGEGKTLVATLAVTLRALQGKGVHVVTVND
jgi:preprotein translocase subunit SecA